MMYLRFEYLSSDNPTVWVFFHIPPSNSLTPAGNPVIKLNPDTIYLEIASDPKGLGLSPIRLSPTLTSGASYMSRWSPVFLTYQL